MTEDISSATQSSDQGEWLPDFDEAVKSNKIPSNGQVEYLEFLINKAHTLYRFRMSELPVVDKAVALGEVIEAFPNMGYEANFAEEQVSIDAGLGVNAKPMDRFSLLFHCANCMASEFNRDRELYPDPARNPWDFSWAKGFTGAATDIVMLMAAANAALELHKQIEKEKIND